MKKNLSKIIKNMARNHCIVFSIMTVAVIVIMELITLRIGSYFIKDEYIPMILSQIVPICLGLSVANIILPKDSLGFRKKGFIYGIILSWLFILYSINNFDINYLSTNGIIIPTLSKIIELIIYCIAIGLYEEIMMRGVVLNNLINVWGSSKRGVVLSVIVSSMIFGIAHLINFVYYPTLINATISQIFYATIVGIFFGSVYLRSKNLFAVALLHGFFDFASKFKYVFSTFTEVEGAIDITMQSGIIFVVFTFPLAIMGLFLLRKVKPYSKVNLDN